MLRVFVADDSLGFGTLAAAWLETYADIAVVGAARTAPDAIAALGAARPDVVILDRLLPQREHSEAVLEHVRRELPDAAVLLISGMPGPDLAREAALSDVDGFLSKAANADALSAAVRDAAAARRRA